MIGDEQRAEVLRLYHAEAWPVATIAGEKHPRLRASRLYDMCVARGYRGGPDHFRHCLRRLRPRRVTEAYLRRKTLPGEEAQVDWAHFGRVPIGRARRPLVAFAMVLSWPRMLFVRFFLSAKMECFLRGHVLALEAFGGSPWPGSGASPVSG